MAANHSISIGLLFHLIVFTEIEDRSRFITEILATEGYRLAEAEFFLEISIEFRYRFNRTKDFSFIFGSL
ncbi:hypothetical protein QUB57_32755 [Microcoleus sp. F6_C1]